MHCVAGTVFLFQGRSDTIACREASWKVWVYEATTRAPRTINRAHADAPCCARPLAGVYIASVCCLSTGTLGKD